VKNDYGTEQEPWALNGLGTATEKENLTKYFPLNAYHI
jgi:hypothetical protein